MNDRMKMDEILSKIESACKKTTDGIDTYRHADRSEESYFKQVEESIECLSTLIEMFNLKRENDELRRKG